MSATETALSALERNWGMVDQSLEGLDDKILASCPNNQSNSICWLLWHMTRVADVFVHTRFQDAPQLWVKDGWHQKFDMPSDPQDTGRGWTAEQTASWQAPTKDILVGYYEAVKTAARTYLEPLTASDLEKQVPFPALPNTASLGSAMGVLVYDNIVHGGQIAYLRGYYQGMGWFA